MTRLLPKGTREQVISSEARQKPSSLGRETGPHHAMPALEWQPSAHTAAIHPEARSGRLPDPRSRIGAKIKLVSGRNGRRLKARHGSFGQVPSDRRGGSKAPDRTHRPPFTRMGGPECCNPPRRWGDAAKEHMS